MRLAAADSRVEESNMANQDATVPLLSQIASLESSLMIAKTDWSSLEISLLQRCQAAEKERNDVWADFEELGRKFKITEAELVQEKSLRISDERAALLKKQKETIVCEFASAIMFICVH